MYKNVLLKLIEAVLIAVCWIFSSLIKITIDIGKIAATIAEVTVFTGVFVVVYELLKYWQLPAIMIMMVGLWLFAASSIVLFFWQPAKFVQLFSLKGGGR